MKRGHQFTLMHRTIGRLYTDPVLYPTKRRAEDAGWTVRQLFIDGGMPASDLSLRMSTIPCDERGYIQIAD